MTLAPPRFPRPCADLRNFRRPAPPRIRSPASGDTSRKLCNARRSSSVQYSSRKAPKGISSTNTISVLYAISVYATSVARPNAGGVRNGGFPRAIWRFALSTGCRGREITGLEWGRVDLERRTACLDRTKNGTPRVQRGTERCAKSLNGLVGRAGVEPATNGLKVRLPRCSGL